MKNTDKILLLLGAATSAAGVGIFFNIMLSKSDDASYVHVLFFGFSSIVMTIFSTICATLYLQNKLYLFRRILTNANDAITISDTDGKLIWQNTANAALTGYGDISNKNKSTSFFVGENKIQIKDELDKISHFSGLFKIDSKNGKQNVWISAFKVSDELENTICYVEIKRELSEFVRLLESTKSEKNRLQSELQTDYLTKILNRNGFLSKLDDYIETEPKHSGSIVFIDIDKFKNINDTYGHKTGDEILVAVASSLKRHTRSVDVAARWGGEEFVLLLAADVWTASTICEHLRQEIERLYPLGISVTCSFGVCGLGDSIEKSIENADSAMYIAKNSGRNQVVVFENNNQNP